jgi:hypothetical protein
MLTNEPALSAIVVVPDIYDTVHQTMGHLKMQTAVNRMEIVLVTTLHHKLDFVESELACFHSWQIVEVEKMVSIAAGYFAGIQQANAPIVALTEDHSFPDVNWAELLIIAHQQSWAAVGPSMCNANPDSLLSWADFYQAYGDWTQPMVSKTMRHLPGHNSSYKRHILLSYKEQLGYLLEAESVLHRHLRADGYELFLESGTCTTHLNFDSWSSLIPVRYYSGRQFASTWARPWTWIRRFLFTVAFPVIPFLRLWRVWRQMSRTQSFRFFLRLLPILFAGFILESFGHMMGFAAGSGNCNEKIRYYEFNRSQQIKQGVPSKI